MHLPTRSYHATVLARRRSALVCVLTVLAALAGAGPAQAAQTGFVSAAGQSVNGPDKATDLGVGWARLFLNWKDAEHADEGRAAASEHGGAS